MRTFIQRGSVTFEVDLDHVKAYDSGLRTGSTALQNPSCMAGHICLGMDQRGTVIVVTMRVRRVIAGLFVALAKERQIQSFRGRGEGN